MELDKFFDNFELMADTPNGVQMLRQMILKLAVQGKLVPQDPKDEPASVLLEKVQRKRKALIKQKKIRKQKELKAINTDQVPYLLPENWTWCRMGNLVASYIDEFVDGPFGSNLKASEYVNKGVPILRIQNIDRNLFKNKKIKHVTKEKARQLHRHNFKGGDIIITKLGDPVGKACIVPLEFEYGIIVADLVRLRVDSSLYDPKYLTYAINSETIISQFSDGITGITRQRVNLTKMRNLLTPIPPFNEQKNIVAKVDELMALCDELEAHKQQVNIHCIQLNDVSIHKLLTTREPSKFSNHWQRICNNFDLLYSKPENVNKLRQAILQLAVQGKLVPQDPKDEPASVLLEKIRAEKERLVKEKKIKKPKKFPSIDPRNVPYKLPNGWEWVKLEQIRKTIEYGTSSKASVNDIGIPILRMNNIQNGKLFYDNLKYVKKDIKDLPRLLLKKNDILFNRTNSYELVGKTALYPLDDDFYTFASYLIRVSIFTDWIDAEFIANAMNSYYFRNTQIEPEVTQQCGQANFNGTKLANTLLPLPPMQEQKRIVAKINKLMAYCDELESKLSKSQMDCDNLMEAAVVEILAA